jgi:hypothetical protein
MAFIFTLKIIFYLLLLDFLILWTGRQKQRNTGVNSQNVPRFRIHPARTAG